MTHKRAGTVGIIANPAAGKDIRRLVSAASPTSDMAKIGIVRRALVGAVEGGAERVLIGDDHKSLGRHALHGLDQELAALVEIIEGDIIPSPIHTRRMAARFSEMGVGALVVLGGDGTHRDVVKGWRNAPLVAVSTGTNNVFPQMIEATVAGHAAGVAASGRHKISDLAFKAKVLDVTGDDVDDDLGLVDVGLVEGMFTASRAVWDLSLLHELVVTTSEPATIGLSSVAARLCPVARDEPGGVHVRLGDGGETVRAPIMPGLYQDVSIRDHRRLDTGDSVTLAGPGVVAFDGERDMVINEGQSVNVRLSADGPWVINPAAAMALI